MGDHLEAGTTIADRYVVEGLVGVGGIAEVYRVRHAELGSQHALKVLTWRRKSLADRFLKEGMFQAQLGHPNVVAVTDILRFDGHVALVMEYVDGITLEQWLAQHGALPVQDAFALFVPVLAAVAAAHDRKVFHRDLKPANVLLAQTAVGWVPKVADFGIAKFVVEEMGEGKTSEGMAMGSPGYMAPEQIRDSSSVDQRADVFALGAILFEMVTGRKAFADADGMVAITSTLDRDPPELELADLSPDAASAIRKAMSKDREQRFVDCRAFARALGIGSHPLLLEMSERSERRMTFDSPSSGIQTPQPTFPTQRPSTTVPPSSTWLMVPFAVGTFAMIGMAALLLLAVAVFAGVRSRWTDRDAPVAAIEAPSPSGSPSPTPAPTATATPGSLTPGSPT
ncbi:MAG: serine/threonine-protein kinase, partial [Myxococcota bacterium]